MKRLKINLALLAVLLGVTSSFAFKSSNVHKAHKQTEVWFMLTAGADPTKPASYTKISGDPPCPGTLHLCAIEGPDQGTSRPSQNTVDSPDDTAQRDN